MPQLAGVQVFIGKLVIFSGEKGEEKLMGNDIATHYMFEKARFSSAGKLRTKTGRTMVALSVGKGIASFCRSVGIVGEAGKIIAACGFDHFAGLRPKRWV